MIYNGANNNSDHHISNFAVDDLTKKYCQTVLNKKIIVLNSTISSKLTLGLSEKVKDSDIQK